MIDLDFVERLIQSVDQSSIDTVEIERGGTRIRLSKTPEVAQAPAPPPAVPANPAPPSPQGAPNPTVEPAQPPATDGEGGAEPDGRENWVDVTSPMVGTFYRAPAPDAAPFTDVGGLISQGDTLCIIEAMKLMNELEAEMDGTVREICVENGEPVEYGQVLFRVEPS